MIGPSNQAPHSTLQRDLTRTYFWGLQSAENMMWRAKGNFSYYEVVYGYRVLTNV